MEHPKLKRPPVATGSPDQSLTPEVVVSFPVYRTDGDSARFGRLLHARDTIGSPPRAPHVDEIGEALEALVTKVFRVVLAGDEIDFGAAWDRLFLVGVQAGLSHLVCQQHIGSAVARCRNELTEGA